MKKLSSIKMIIVACMSACFFLSTSCGTAPKMASDTTYKVMKVSLSDKELFNKYSAAVKGRQSVEIRPQVSGTITQVCIAEGATVKKGESLFIIDQTPYKAALMTAVANVESAQANVANSQLMADSKSELFKQNVVSDYDLQTSKNALLANKAVLSQAKAQELNARNNLSYTVVKSPVDGVASMIPYRVGALVNPSIVEPLVTVADDKEMYVYFSMTESQILSIARQNGSLGDAMRAMPEVQLQLSDGTTYDKNGKIDAISGIIDPTTGSISIRATFQNPNHILRSGGVGNVVFPYGKKDCIVIPQSATYEIQDRIFVYKVVDGKSVSTQVTAFEINDGKEYIIESGLEIGDVIVAEGAGLLQEGMTITPAGSASVADSSAVTPKN
ncbi:MAG: efflux RND transporter periplasmic adaptor subunit [Rikenellaceae bacterium]